MAQTPDASLRSALGGALAALLVGCAAPLTSESVADDWLRASPVLEQQLIDEAERLPWTHGLERLEQIRWFAAVGEPAYELLLDLIADEREHVSAAALAALGATGDRRLVPHIRDVPWSEERRNSDLDLERARTLVRLGDWSEIPTLIDGLRDERVYTRALCAQALRESTQIEFEFDARADAKERDKAARAWEEWWWRRQGEGILGAER